MRALVPLLGLVLVIAACGDSDTSPPVVGGGDASDSSPPQGDASDAGKDIGASPGDAEAGDEKPIVDGSADSDAAPGDGDAAPEDGPREADVAGDTGMDVSVICNGGTVDCTGTGACVDLQTNPLHCGKCMHDCLGGSCQGAQCQPVPIATGIRTPMGVVVVNGIVYATNFGFPPYEDGTLIRIMPDGTVSTIESHLQAPHALWYDSYSDSFLLPEYFGRPVGDAGAPPGTVIDKRPLSGSDDGGSVAPYLTNNVGDPLGIATNQDYIFNVSVGGPITDGQMAIQRRRRSDLVEDANFSEYPNGPAHMDIDANYLYWTETVAGRIVRLPLNVTPSVSAVEVLIPNVPNARGIAVEGTTIFFTTYSAPLVDGGPLFGSVQRVNNAPGAIPTKLVTMPGQLEDVAVDAKAIYVAGRGNGTVWRIAK
jgi:hypothetical protein